MVTDQEAQSEAAEQGAWARAASVRRGEVIMAVALLATAVFFMWQSLYLPFGRIGLPGPGFFPFALGVALAVLALAILISTLSKPDDGEAVFIGHRDVLIALAALSGVAFAFDKADSYLALGIFAATLLLFIARAPLWRVLLGTTLGMMVVWAVFKVALGVRLPAGDFWQQIADFVMARLPFGPF